MSKGDPASLTSDSLLDLHLLDSPRQHAPSHEVHEGYEVWCQGHEQRSFAEDHCHRTGLQGQDLLAGAQQFRDNCDQGGEKDWCLRNSWLVPYQDSGEAGHEGRSEVHVWQGGEGCRKASQDRREGLCGSSFEEADLELRSAVALACPLRGLLAVGIPPSRLEMGNVRPW